MCFAQTIVADANLALARGVVGILRKQVFANFEAAVVVVQSLAQSAGHFLHIADQHLCGGTIPLPGGVVRIARRKFFAPLHRLVVVGECRCEIAAASLNVAVVFECLRQSAQPISVFRILIAQAFSNRQTRVVAFHRRRDIVLLFRDGTEVHVTNGKIPLQ